MKSVLSVVLALAISAFAGNVLAIEDADSNSLIAKCKSEASSEEIPSADIHQFMKQCLEDYGLPAAEMEAALQNLPAPAKKEED